MGNLAATRSRQAAVILAGVFFVSVFLWNQSLRLCMKSGDFAGHYHMVHEIGTYLTGHLPPDKFASDLLSYPIFSHFVAALLGSAIGSYALAMHLVALVCVFGVSAMMLFGLQRFSQFESVTAWIVFVLGLFAIGRLSSTYGFEVIGNYFYAQIFGEFLFLFILLAVSATGSVTRLVVSYVGVIALGWVYSLSAAKLAVACMVLMLACEATKWLKRKRMSWSLELLAVFLPLAVVLHPRYRHAVGISQNDGSLPIGVPLELIPVLALIAIGLGAVLFVQFFLGRSRLRWPLFLSSAAVGMGGVALAQTALYFTFELGSPYAVKKHVFGLLTVLVACLVSVAMNTIRDMKIHRCADSAGAQSSRSDERIFVVALALTCAFSFALYSRPCMALSPFLDYQRSLAELRRHSGNEFLSNTASMNIDFDPVLNYAASLVDLDLPKATADEIFVTQATTGNRILTRVRSGEIRYVVVSPADRAVGADCLVNSPHFASFVIAKYECVSNAQALESELAR